MKDKSTNRVTSFNVSGLKAIKSANVELSPLNYLVGTNSVGKSSLIQGVLCLAGNLRSHRPDSFQLHGSGFSFESINSAINREYSGFSIGVRAEMKKAWTENSDSRNTVQSEISIRFAASGSKNTSYSALGFESGTKQITSESFGYLERVHSKGFLRDLPAFSTWKLTRSFIKNPFGLYKTNNGQQIQSLRSSVIDPNLLSQALSKAITQVNNRTHPASPVNSTIEFLIDGADLLAFAVEKFDWAKDLNMQLFELLSQVETLVPEYWQLETLANDNYGLFSKTFSGALYDHFLEGEQTFHLESNETELGLTPHDLLRANSLDEPIAVFKLDTNSNTEEQCEDFVAKLSIMNPEKMLKQHLEIDSEWLEFSEDLENLSEFVGHNVHYLGPLRSSGLDIQEGSGSSDPLVPVGTKGEYFVAALLQRLDDENQDRSWRISPKNQKLIDLSDVVLDNRTPVERLQAFTFDSASYGFGSSDQFSFKLNHFSGGIDGATSFLKRVRKMRVKQNSNQESEENIDAIDELSYPTPNGQSSLDLKEAFMAWLEYLEIGDSLEFVNQGHLGLQVRLGKDSLHHVGTGVSQVLPVLTICLLAKPGSLTFIEQPELHLHPAAQQKLADFFLAVAQTGRQLFIETHSEYFIHRARRSIAVKEGKPRDIQILFAEQGDGGSSLRKAKIRSTGATTYWPEGFLAESENDIYDIISSNLE